MQVYRYINTIKVCMDSGRTVVLLNLEDVYESLYDALNQVCCEYQLDTLYLLQCKFKYIQYYQEYGAGTRFVDLGLQTHRIKCRVHNEFK